jgi:hypothetical protein
MIGVPHLLMVDRRGQVVFKGLPSYRPDIQSDIVKLLLGEPLS